jgi:ubiquinone/menaquinone biosynthesis C-methylase UbiE
MNIRLHIGCGIVILPGYINCDMYNPKAELKCDALKLPFPDNSVVEILAVHIIEHFHFHDTFNALKEWYRVLKVGGKLRIETPDLLATCIKFVNSNEQDRVDLYGQFFAIPWVPGELHKFLFTESQLMYELSDCKFKNIIRVPALRYINNEDINLAMEAMK